MVVGIPNVGKSTFINALAGKACAKTGNKPGVTKGKQWIRLNRNVELLDTPGILWPKFEDQSVGMKLAFIGSIKDELLQRTELAAEFVKFMQRHYPRASWRRSTRPAEEGGAYAVLEGDSKEPPLPCAGGTSWIWRRRPPCSWMIFGTAGWAG